MKSETIKECRDRLNITQGELARRTGISTSMMGAIERNERRLTKSMKQRIEQVFNEQVKEVSEFIEAYEKLNRVNEDK